MWFGGEQPWEAAGEEVPSHALAPASCNLQLSGADYGVRGLCPPSLLPTGQEPSSSQESRRWPGGCFSGAASLRAGEAGGGSLTVGRLVLSSPPATDFSQCWERGCGPPWCYPHLPCPIITPWHFFIRLCLVSVCVVLYCPCLSDTRPMSPPLPGPHAAIALDPGPQTIVRGSKGAKDGALTLLLDEFENMSVTRSNSLRRDSPPPPARPRQENGMPEEQAAMARGGPEKAGSQGRVAVRSEGGGSSGDRRRAGPEKKPKSSREGSGGPQESSRDKRPLSGPDVGTPQPAGLASGAKVAAGRPFNTYPRADTDHPSRGIQVTDLPALGSPTVPSFPPTNSNLCPTHCPFPS